MTLWVRAESLDFLIRQRSLDRCLAGVIQERCARLSTLSSTNRRLKQLIHAIASAKAAKTAASLLPVTAPLAMTVGEGSIDVMIATARTIAWSQDSLLALDKLSGLKTLACARPNLSARTDGIERGESREAEIAGTPAPLAWTEPASSTFLKLVSDDGRTVSFGWCRPSSGGLWPALDGEAYAVRFDRPDDRTVGRPARPASKRSSY